MVHINSLTALKGWGGVVAADLTRNLLIHQVAMEKRNQEVFVWSFFVFFLALLLCLMFPFTASSSSSQLRSFLLDDCCRQLLRSPI